MTNEVIMNKMKSAADIQKEWDSNPRWKNVKRDYTAEEVAKLSGSVSIEYSLATVSYTHLTLPTIYSV